MGKVRDETAVSKAAKTAPRPSWVRETLQKITPFFANFLVAEPYKPHQGWYARIWTAVGLGLILGVGVLRLFQILQAGSSGLALQFGVPAMLAALAGWFVYRIIHYPPFADFLIATEAEMNKVSWTTKADLYRATLVVLATVFLLSVFLFAVDYIWSTLLQWIGVLKFDGGGAFGSTS